MPNILNTFPKKRKRRVVAGFMGTYIPKSQADYVTLYCNAFEKTKISILKDLLTGWITQNIKVHTPAVLEDKMAKRAFQVWKRTEGQSFETFVSLLKFELKNKKLEPETIGRILNILEDEKNKNC